MNPATATIFGYQCLARSSTLSPGISKPISDVVFSAVYKVLCHNLTTVVMEQCELGIEPVFWPDHPGEIPSVLRLPGRA